MRSLHAVVLLSIAFQGSAEAARPKHQNKVLMFGNLHAHSRLSDDVDEHGDELSPRQAFLYAQQHGLDFLAISDHHKAVDSNHRLFLTEDEYTKELWEVARAHNKKNAGKLIAIPAIEWGNTATGNHLNVFGAKTLPPDSIKDAQYDVMFAWAKNNAEFMQFNHPNAWAEASDRNKKVGNFGEALFASESQFLGASSPVRTVSIISSVGGGHITGEHAKSEKKTHRAVRYENFRQFLAFLNKGLRLSPAANQDTHRKNFGTVTAARTAVWADSESYEGLMAGIRANRIYATEDDELAIAFQAALKGKSVWSGETLSLGAEEADIDLLVKIWQAPGVDSDPVSEGPYTVTVFSDYDGVGGRQAAEWTTVEDLQANKDHKIKLHVLAGEYIFLRVTEQNGKDNPVGDGVDESNNATGAPGSDGNRDDMNDSAWTTPIWFVAEAKEGTFVWAKGSKLYHDPGCWVVKQIGAANRRTGTPPASSTKHACSNQ